MAATFTIQLHDVQFSAAHGVYDEEATLGNRFIVNLSLTVIAPERIVTSIDDTINYAAVFQTVKDIFSKRQALLETVAMEIAVVLKDQFPALQKISIQITKLHPPINTFSGSVSVTYNKEF